MNDNFLLMDIKDVDIENFYSVKEVSKLTKKAETTVRYWVREGKISSIKVLGPYGEQILIPKSEINTPINPKEILASKKDLDIQIVSKSIAQCILDEISSEFEKRDEKLNEIITVVKEIQSEREILKKDLENMQEKHFRELDKKLSKIMEEKQKSKPSFINKFISLFTSK